MNYACSAAVPVVMLAVDTITIDDFMLSVEGLAGKREQVGRRGAGYRSRHLFRIVWTRPEFHARSNPT